MSWANTYFSGCTTYSPVALNLDICVSISVPIYLIPFVHEYNLNSDNKFK